LGQVALVSKRRGFPDEGVGTASLRFAAVGFL